MFRTFALSGALLVAAMAPMAQAEILIEDPYARAASPIAKSGAAFFVITNTGTEDDLLVAAEAPIAQKVELHTHTEDANGIMKMHQIEGGIPVPAGGQAVLARGGDHVMFMGLTSAMEQGESFPLTLTFEQAGQVTVEMPVDLERKPDHGAGH